MNVAHWRLRAHYANEGVIGQSYSPSEFREHRRLRSAYICIAAVAAAVIKEIRQGHNPASLTQFIQLHLLCFAQIKKRTKITHPSTQFVKTLRGVWKHLKDEQVRLTALLLSTVWQSLSRDAAAAGKTTTQCGSHNNSWIHYGVFLISAEHWTSECAADKQETKKRKQPITTPLTFCKP